MVNCRNRLIDVKSAIEYIMYFSFSFILLTAFLLNLYSAMVIKLGA